MAIALILPGAVLFGACNRKSESPRYSPGSDARVLSVDMAALKPAIAQRTGQGDRPAWVTAERWKRVRGLYQRFGDAPLWLQGEGVRERAGALLAAIRSAPEHGLDTAAYPISALQAVVDAKRLTASADAGALADADVLLTAAYVAYAADMLSGQVDPKTVSQAWHIPAIPREIDSALVRGIEAQDMKVSLAAMAPQDPDYDSLRVAFARYRQLAAAGGWSMTVKNTPAAALLQRLAQEGFVPTDSTALPPLLRVYQQRHGLAPTGTLDQGTLAALNVTADHRAAQISANLERHRWLPRSLGSRYVYVNVPAFHLTAYDSGRKSLEMKVVVGQEFEGRITPVFSDSMETVVFRPYWNVTPDIQRLEIGPKAAADPGYLEANDMEYYKDGSVTRIRQRPGEKNSLGLVKFLFPNTFNIYLHDTPEKALFAQTDRAASHGCIRLEKPVELAQWVLGWDAARITGSMKATTDNQPVRVSPKIPVYIVYFTAYLRDGQLYFSEDIYGRDEKLEAKVVAGAEAEIPQRDGASVARSARVAASRTSGTLSRRPARNASLIGAASLP